MVLDTASDVPWVQCHPSASATDITSSSNYDPARSATYTALACNSAACAELGRLYRGACVNNHCQYRVPIPSSPSLSSSSGTYGSDLLALAADPANGALSFKFGCSHAEAKQGEEGSLDNATAGVMALGKDFQTGQAHRASTGTMLIWPGTKTARPASPVPVPSTARPRARAWAAMPARWHGTGTARSRGRHGVGTAWSRWMETPAIPSRWM